MWPFKSSKSFNYPAVASLILKHSDAAARFYAADRALVDEENQQDYWMDLLMQCTMYFLKMAVNEIGRRSQVLTRDQIVESMMNAFRETPVKTNAEEMLSMMVSGKPEYMRWLFNGFWNGDIKGMMISPDEFSEAVVICEFTKEEMNTFTMAYLAVLITIFRPVKEVAIAKWPPKSVVQIYAGTLSRFGQAFSKELQHLLSSMGLNAP